VILPMLAALVAALTVVAPAVAGRPPAASNVIEGQYIVVYKRSVRSPSAETYARERRLGFESEHRYRRALEGFSAKLSQAQLAKLRSDPEVDFVSEDRRVSASDNVPLMSGDEAPTGVRRILAGTASTARQPSGANVAVIDTGIKLSHTDLDAVDGTNCIDPGTPGDDDNGHGTHVAGSIAAKNNGAGVVGVAPGTKTYAVKVLDSAGTGSWASVICGVDWVTANAAALNIRVANMSLGGAGAPVGACATTTDAMHTAICNSTGAGVNYVVAAGNNEWDFDFAPEPDVPAAYPQVLTVTALSDSDGRPGGTGGPPGCGDDNGDDSAATFSNFALTAGGSAHTIAAPGVCINSTWNDGGYETISGTSMASPHMAGIVALCIDEAGEAGPCATKTPGQLISYVRADAETYNRATPSYGFTGDPLHSPTSAYYGFLSRGDLVPPDTSITSGPPELTDSPSASFGFLSTQAGSSFACRLDAGAWQACSSPASYSGLADGSHTFGVRATDPAGNTDPTEATGSWSIVTTPPAPANAGPANLLGPALIAAAARLDAKQFGAAMKRAGMRRLARRGAAATADSLGAGLWQLKATALNAGAAARVVVATGRTTFANPGARKVRVRATRRGKRILRRAPGLRVRVTVSFTPTLGKAVSRSRTVKLAP